MSVSTTPRFATKSDSVIEVDRDMSVLHLATIVYAAALPTVEVWFLILDPAAHAHAWLAVLAAAMIVPLHLRFVWLALRGESPRRAEVTVVVMAVVALGAGVVIGAAWVKMLAVVGSSGLIVLRRRAAAVTFVGSVATGWLVAAFSAPAQHSPPGLAYVTYLSLTIAWRSVALFALVWLVTSYRGLVSARAELRTEAVNRERQRVNTELASSVDARLSRLVDLGRSYATVGSDEVDEVLTRINRDAAEALGRARELVAGYRSSTREGELRAAVALLAAADVRADVLGDGADVGAPSDAGFRAQLQAAVRQAVDLSAGSRVAFLVRTVDGVATVELWAPDGRGPVDGA